MGDFGFIVKGGPHQVAMVPSRDTVRYAASTLRNDTFVVGKETHPAAKGLRDLGFGAKGLGCRV